MEEKKYEQALQSVDAAIAKMPRQFGYLIVRSEINTAMGREIDALADIDEFARGAGVTGHYYRAKTYERLGQTENAIAEYNV